jgi:hypothetical protein
MQHYYLMSPRTLANAAPLRDFRCVDLDASVLIEPSGCASTQLNHEAFPVWDRSAAVPASLSLLADRLIEPNSSLLAVAQS